MATYPNETHVSPHLTWQELACHDAACTPYPMRWRMSRAVALAHAFEAVRAACGSVPLQVLSGYRTPEHNASVGGAQLSQHVEGRAMDLYTPTGMTRDEFERRVRQANAAGAGIHGIGRYAWGLHLDVRPADKLIVWHAKRSETVR